MLRFLSVLLLLLPSVAAAQASAQMRGTPGSELRISAGGRTIEAAPALHRGYLAHRAIALRSLGARVEKRSWGAIVVLFGDTLRFETLSPFFRVGGRAQQLVAPVYAEGGVLYLPHQFFVEWLPARYPERLRYGGGQLALVPSIAGHSPRQLPIRVGAGAEPMSRPAEPPEGRNGAVDPTEGGRPVRVVIIDAGHGGPDPGRIGPNGVREEDVTLEISRRLAALLRERSGYEVHLTRTTDTLIALGDRPRMANQWKAGRPAALFLSIHANAFSPEVQGFETFFLSDARTQDERRVAEMENAAVAYEDGGSKPPTDAFEHILNTLRNNFYIHASNDLAGTIQRGLAGFHPGPNRGVKQAGFRVLVGAFMPAVLVETAFISNPEEAELLASDEFQQKIAWALAEAIDRFFSTHEHLWSAGG